MDRRRCDPELMICLGYLAVLSVVTTQPCVHEDTLMRNQDCIGNDNCGKDKPHIIRECGNNTECYSARFRAHTRIYCRCKKGFTSITGESTFNTRTDCVDINECEAGELCGPNASCHNTVGNYYCVCNQGFQSSGEIHFPASSTTFCRDINECDDNDNNGLCGPNQSCHNTEGSYICSCNQGLESSGQIDSFDLTKKLCQEISSGVHTRIREREAPDNGNMVPDNRNTPVLVNGNTPAPVNGNTPEPLHANTPAPVNGNTPAPVNGNTPEPLHANTPAPVNGNTPEPVNGNTPEPLHGNTPAPVNGNTPEPLHANTPAPVNGNTPEPVNGNTPEPLHGNTPALVNGNTPEPLHGKAPVNGNTPEPVNGNTPEPVNGNTPEPVNGNTPEPVNGNTPEPLHGNTPAPVTGNTPAPVNGNTPEPVNGKMLVPVNGNTPEPLHGNTSTPVNGNTPAPVNRITPAPFNGNTAEPLHGNPLEPLKRYTPVSVNGNTPAPVHAPSPTPPTEACAYNVSTAGTTGIDPSLLAAPEQPDSPVELFCSIMTNASWLLGELCQKPAEGLPIENVISLTTKLFMEESPLKEMQQEERLNLASQILQGVERAAIMAALNSEGQRLKNITNKAIDLHLQVIDVNSSPTNDKMRLETKGNAMEISWRTVTGSKMTGSVAVAFIVYDNMDSVLHGAHYENKETSEKYEDVQLHSRVISAAFGSSGNYNLPIAVSFLLKHKKDPTVGGKRLCVYWSHTTNGSHWSPRGCELVGSNDTHTTCQCDHLSSFAILMAFSEELQDYSHDTLSVIMFIGIPISLVCLAVAIGTFIFCSQARNAITATHMHLCISLFLAELLFITGIDSTRYQTVCGIIAGCLHYLFLTAFAWMSLVSTQLYLMVRNLKNMRVSHSSNIEKYIYPLGYGPPALIVVISAAVYPNGYGSRRNCWLQVENEFIWSFLGPVYLIILINTFMFTMTLCTLNEELSNRDMKVSKIKDTRMLTFKAIGQVFILGCTWILGLFHFQEETVVMAYLFTIVNSFQGTFIFIILCVLNPKIRAEYHKWINPICKTRRSLFESESTKVPLSVTSETV
ncbi:adhesion G protein-coupled receptor E1-like [Carcharodon carcharias]|uniref:adhesion G protein-coupled receptor E1-like n=1 Tax=Carcharodon carcharias TaxID=13397 RepID=UPI001B7E5697|nr:adhesion G protein-coupled receptor E1-like [Carcharodon carcharias]